MSNCGSIMVTTFLEVISRLFTPTPIHSKLQLPAQQPRLQLPPLLPPQPRLQLPSLLPPLLPQQLPPHLQQLLQQQNHRTGFWFGMEKKTLQPWKILVVEYLLVTTVCSKKPVNGCSTMTFQHFSSVTGTTMTIWTNIF